MAVTRSTALVAVHDGDIYLIDAGVAALATGGSGALNSAAAQVYAEAAFGKIYFVDGSNYKVLDPTNNTVSTWTASAGSLPVSGSNKARLIALWAGRLVLSGLEGDAHNWFMPVVADPDDWDYGATVTDTQAVAGNNSVAGLVGDVITSLIPWNDDLLLFGCDHSIWRLTGNPMAGGVIDRVSDITGVAWGRSWTKDPAGVIYFFGSRGGVYRMSPGSVPERLTNDRIEERLADVDLAQTVVRLVWDDRQQGLYVMLSPFDDSETTTHYFWDSRLNGWWPVQFGNTDHNGLAVHLFDGDDPGDRVVLLGTRDGKILKFDHDADDDDGTAISSHVLLGPVTVEDLPFVLSEIQAVLSSGSDSVSYSVHVGDNAEEARNAAAAYSGTFGTAGRNRSVNPRSRGYAAYVKVSNSTLNTSWALERLAVRLSVVETSRRRSF